MKNVTINSAVDCDSCGRRIVDVCQDGPGVVSSYHADHIKIGMAWKNSSVCVNPELRQFDLCSVECAYVIVARLLGRRSTAPQLGQLPTLPTPHEIRDFARIPRKSKSSRRKKK